MPANECIPVYEVADRITGEATENLTGKRFVVVDATSRAKGGLAGLGTDAAPSAVNYKISVPAAGVKCFGVAMWDIASGAKGPVIREGIVPVEVGATPVVAGTQVEVDNTGKVIPWAGTISTQPVGYCCAGASAAGIAEIALYK